MDSGGHAGRGRRFRTLLVPGVALLLYGLFSLLTLSRFPFVHSDEVWLASLTRSMLAQGSPAATEDFLVLTPRFPHAIKLLFHILQMPFVVVSFSAFSVRLLSWAASVGSVLLLGLAAFTGWVGRPALPATPSRTWPALVARAAVPVLAAVDIQLLYVFHTARQEALLTLVMSACLLLFLARADSWRRRDTVTLGLVLVASIGIHPNSFIIAAPFVPLMLTIRPAGRGGASPSEAGQPLGGHRQTPGVDSASPGVAAATERNTQTPSIADHAGANDRLWGRRLGELGILVGILAAGAAVFVGLSFLMDREFLAHYAAFGESVGVADSFPRRWYRLVNFFRKLATQTSGTYYLPPIRGWMMGGAAVIAGSLVVVVVRGVRAAGCRLGRLLIVVAAVIAAIFAIGKYSPPSIVFLFPPVLLLTGALAEFLVEAVRGAGRGAAGRTVEVAVTAVLVLAVAASAVNTGREVSAWVARQSGGGSYSTYTKAISEHLGPGETVLANLNAGFVVDAGRHRTWRDLDSLADAGLTFADFVEDEGISLIAYPDELDLIYRERPVWNVLYGNLHPYFDELQVFLDERCELVAVVPSPVYAMRIVSQIDSKGARLRLYRVTQ